MILNKFRPFLAGWNGRLRSLWLLAFVIFSCNKSADINGNHAFIKMSHVAYGVGPVKVSLKNGSNQLFAGALPFDSITGTPANPYDTVTSQVTMMYIMQGTDSLLHGNSAFQQMARYSMFLYDSLDQRSVNLLILQDNPPVSVDTFSYIRYLNFAPGTVLGLKLVYHRPVGPAVPNYRDSVYFAENVFVGRNPNPAAYRFTGIHLGSNEVFIYKDSAQPAADSSNFHSLGNIQVDTLSSYDLLLQGFRLNRSERIQDAFPAFVKAIRANSILINWIFCG